jgi:hypothetical protein
MDSTRVRVALTIGLVLIAGAVALTLTQAPASLARRSTNEDQVLTTTRRRAVTCQSGETLPRGTSAIRVHIFAEYGPEVALQVLQHGQLIAHASQQAGWTGGAFTVSIAPPASTLTGVTLCYRLALNGDETLSQLGEATSPHIAAHEGTTVLPGRVTVEYLRPGSSSWWSLVQPVARRMGLGHIPSGRWSVGLVAALMAGVLALCSGLIVRELR